MSTPEAPANETAIGEIRLSGLFAGRYQIAKELAKGGMGIVYKAHDNVLDKTVALKLILYRDRSEDQLLRFQREAQASSRLLHPNIAIVYNFGLDENSTPYMVLEFVEGKTIKRICNKRRFDVLQTLEIGSQLCAALHHAHLNGLVHRDIKSSNVILDESQDPPVAKIIDFGIARIVDTPGFQRTLSSAQITPGSPPYMAPEQVKREPIDLRCDIYSLGCVLFEMLTGKTPFRGDTAIETMQMHVSKQPPLLQSVCQDLEFPDELEGLVAKCLAKKPEERFQSAAELSEAIEKVHEEYVELLADKQRLQTEAEDVDKSAELQEKQRKLRIAITLASIFLITSAVATGVYLFSSDPHVETLRVPQRALSKKPNKAVLEYANDVRDTIFAFDIKRFRRKPSEILLRYQVGDTALTAEKLNQLVPLKVQTLEIFHSELPPNALSIIAKMKTLQCLKLLHDTNVNDTTLKNLKGLPNLVELSLSDHEELTGSVLSSLNQMSITRLNLRNCPSLNPKNLEALSQWKTLEFLDLQNNLIKPEHLKALRKVRTLKVLNLSDSKLQPGTMKVLKEIPALETLLITNTAITDKDLNEIADVKGLVRIDISSCESLTNHGLLRFKRKFPNMRFLKTEPEAARSKQLKRWIPESMPAP